MFEIKNPILFSPYKHTHCLSMDTCIDMAGHMKRWLKETAFFFSNRATHVQFKTPKGLQITQSNLKNEMNIQKNDFFIVYPGEEKNTATLG